MAVAPNSWKHHKAPWHRGPGHEPSLPTLGPPCGPYHHVALNLLIDTGQPVLPAVLGQAGLESSLSPLLIVLFVQVLVGQYQGPQPLPCIFLEAEPRESPHSPLPSTERSRSTGPCPPSHLRSGGPWWCGAGPGWSGGVCPVGGCQPLCSRAGSSPPDSALQAGQREMSQENFRPRASAREQRYPAHLAHSRPACGPQITPASLSWPHR